MLGIEILCIGKLGQDFYRTGCAEYSKRLGAYAKVTVTELPETRLRGNSAAEERLVIEDESVRMLDYIGKRRAAVVVLCVEGERLSSARLAAWLQNTAQTHSDVIFVIGGSLGLSDTIKARADLRLSMSDMTFPHQLARLVLMEQIYRACSINAGSKYHK